MKQIKYILFLFLFLVISCKTLNVPKDDSKSVPKDESASHIDTIMVSDYKLVTNKDSDGDGVVDLYDKCPDIQGSQNNMGCPDIEESQSVNLPVRKNSSRKKTNTPKEVVIQDSQYTTGLIAYKVPMNMTVGNSYLVKIRITKENNKTMLVVGDRKIPIADDVDNSVVEVEDINVSPIMSANLIVSKNSFRIDTLSTEYQNISKRGYTEWAWNIIPLKGGNNLLKLNVKIRIKEDGESYYKDIVVFDKKLNVKSNIKFSIITWISEYWQWLLVTILIPLIKWLYDEWKKRKEENKKKM